MQNEKQNLDDEHFDAEHLKLVAKSNIPQTKAAGYDDRDCSCDHEESTCEHQGAVVCLLVLEWCIVVLQVMISTVEHPEELEVAQGADAHDIQRRHLILQLPVFEHYISLDLLEIDKSKKEVHTIQEHQSTSGQGVGWPNAVLT